MKAGGSGVGRGACQNMRRPSVQGCLDFADAHVGKEDQAEMRLQTEQYKQVVEVE